MKTHIRAFALTATCALVSGCDLLAGAKAQERAANSPSATSVSAVSDPAESSTVTVTATETSTVTETRTETATVTHTHTVNSVATVTQVQVQTVASTVTETVVATTPGPAIEPGRYQTETCFLNALASQGIGQKIYTRSTIRFGRHGRGENSFALFEDEDCRKELMQAQVKIRYTTTVYFDRLILIAVDQYNEPNNKKSLVRYWIPALRTEKGLLLDINAERGAAGPFLEEPSEEQLKALLDGLEERAVLMRKLDKKEKNEEEKEIRLERSLK